MTSEQTEIYIKGRGCGRVDHETAAEIVSCFSPSGLFESHGVVLSTGLAAWLNHGVAVDLANAAH